MRTPKQEITLATRTSVEPSLRKWGYEVVGIEQACVDADWVILVKETTQPDRAPAQRPPDRPIQDKPRIE